MSVCGARLGIVSDRHNEYTMKDRIKMMDSKDVEEALSLDKMLDVVLKSMGLVA